MLRLYDMDANAYIILYGCQCLDYMIWIPMLRLCDMDTNA